MKRLEDLIKTYKDFPKKGIDFKDVLGILQDPIIFSKLIFKNSLINLWHWCYYQQVLENLCNNMTLYLKWYQKYDKSKLKSLNLFNEIWTFNFDLSYFWFPLSYRVIQYLIWKLSDMVKMGRKGLVELLLLCLFGGLEKWEFTT